MHSNSEIMGYSQIGKKFHIPIIMYVAMYLMITEDEGDNDHGYS